MSTNRYPETFKDIKEYCSTQSYDYIHYLGIIESIFIFIENFCKLSLFLT